ncbi:MAG: serine/threonine-protein kinase [Pseudomonadota bacterium]
MSLKKLGRYDLIRVLGKGAMGLVYEGRDPNLDRRVAIKTIKVENLSDESAAEYEVRFRTEARSAARLQHPNIVSVYDSDRDGDIAFLVMEFIQGDDLKHHLDKGELYTLEQTLGIMADLLSALDYAHRQNIVHRDIKPANLLIEPDGRVKLTDFGVARIQDSGEATRTQGSIVGTLKYMSPEQLQGRPIDARADLFAAGVVLYQLLTGKRPFDGDTDFAVIQKIVGHNPEAATSFNPKLPPAIDAVVARALAKARDQRYATAQEFAAALQAACRDASDATVLPPASPAGQGNNATWTATLMAGESLLSSQSGTSSSASTVTQEVELVYWKDIKDSSDVEDIQGFLDKFPSGIYADLARRRLKKLGALPGGDDSDIGSRPGTVTQLSPGLATQPDKTALITRGSLAGDTGVKLKADTTDLAWQALEATAAQAAPSFSSTMQPAPAAGLKVDAEATRLGGLDVVPPPVQAEAAQTSPPVPAPAPEPVQKPARPKTMVLAIAGVAVLALAGIGFKLLPGSGSAGPVSAAEAPASAAAGAPLADASAALPAATAPALVKEAAVASPPAAAVASAAAAPAHAASKAAAAALAAAAKKAANDKDKPAKQPAPAKNTPAGTAASVAERAAPAAPASPRQACEDRMLLGFQICMAEQCAKPAFTNHPVCVERRAMEQRREADRQR